MLAPGLSTGNSASSPPPAPPTTSIIFQNVSPGSSGTSYNTRQNAWSIGPGGNFLTLVPSESVGSPLGPINGLYICPTGASCMYGTGYYHITGTTGIAGSSYTQQLPNQSGTFTVANVSNAGDLPYYNGTTFAVLAGNTVAGTRAMTENSSGVAAWTTLAASATTDTTNAANITSGTLPPARFSTTALSTGQTASIGTTTLVTAGGSGGFYSVTAEIGQDSDVTCSTYGHITFTLSFGEFTGQTNSTTSNTYTFSATKASAQHDVHTNGISVWLPSSAMLTYSTTYTTGTGCGGSGSTYSFVVAAVETR